MYTALDVDVQARRSRDKQIGAGSPVGVRIDVSLSFGSLNPRHDTYGGVEIRLIENIYFLYDNSQLKIEVIQ